MVRPVSHLLTTTSFRPSASTGAAPCRSRRGEQRAPILAVAPGEHAVDVLEHGTRAHVGQKPEASAIHAEQGHVMAGHQARRIQQRTVTADGDDEFGTRRERLFRAGRDSSGREGQPDPGIDQRAQAPLMEVPRHAQHALGHAQILGVAHESHRLE